MNLSSVYKSPECNRKRTFWELGFHSPGWLFIHGANDLCTITLICGNRGWHVLTDAWENWMQILWLIFTLTCCSLLNSCPFLPLIISISFWQVSCKILHFFHQYMMACNYFWMLCEGIYLHTLIVVAVFAEKQRMRWYYLLGWGMYFPQLSVESPSPSSVYSQPPSSLSLREPSVAKVLEEWRDTSEDSSFSKTAW